MTRDFELVRKLLVFFDERQDLQAILVPQVEGDYSENQIKYHVLLLYQAGLLDGEPEKSKTSDRVIRVHAMQLTWQGHEFLAAIRAQGVWQRVRTAITTTGGAMTLDLVKDLAVKYAKEQLGLPT